MDDVVSRVVSPSPWRRRRDDLVAPAVRVQAASIGASAVVRALGEGRARGAPALIATGPDRGTGAYAVLVMRVAFRWPVLRLSGARAVRRVARGRDRSRGASDHDPAGEQRHQDARPPGRALRGRGAPA